MKATYVSVWGGQAISTSCEFDPGTMTVTDIEQYDGEVDGDFLEDEYIVLQDGTRISGDQLTFDY